MAKFIRRGITGTILVGGGTKADIKDVKDSILLDRKVLSRVRKLPKKRTIGDKFLIATHSKQTEKGLTSSIQQKQRLLQRLKKVV